MAALLGRLVAAQRTEHAAARRVPLGCLSRLLQAFDGQRSGPGIPAAPVPGMAEHLTARELEVLGLLPAGRSNQAIAAELVVASTPLRSTSPMSWTSSARPTAPGPSPGRASWADSLANTAVRSPAAPWCHAGAPAGAWSGQAIASDYGVTPGPCTAG